MSVIARQARIATLLSDVVYFRTAVVFARRGGYVFLFASSTTDYRQVSCISIMEVDEYLVRSKSAN